MASELVTDAVRHGSDPRSLRLMQGAGSVRVEVTDGKAGGLVELRHPGVDQAGGRGLLIVDRVASRWGVENTTTSRSVWFEACFELTA